MATKKSKHKTKSRIGNRIWSIGGVVTSVVLLVFLYWYFSLKASQLPVPPLKNLASHQGIELGVHTRLNRLSDRIYPDIITQQFGFLTIDGEAHWKELRPTATTFNFKPADKLIHFATVHHMPVQFHHLVWGEANELPDWLKTGHYTKQQLLDLMHDDITQTVSHYKGQVAEWSVVNEVFSRSYHYYNLKDWWTDHIGDRSFVDNAFRWAHSANPSAKLILNDSENETAGPVSDAMYTYIKEAKARGVPIDGIGMQMHINAARLPTKADVIKNMQRFAKLGVKTYVTEFDVNVNTVIGSDAYKRQVEAKATADMVRACIESKACVSFNIFDLTDKNDLLKHIMGTDSHSFLFDSRFRAKPSFYSFYNALVQT